MACNCTFDNTGETHEWDCPLHPNRAEVKMVKVDVYNNMLHRIKQLQAKNDTFVKYLHGDCKACEYDKLGKMSKHCQMCKMQMSYKWKLKRGGNETV